MYITTNDKEMQHPDAIPDPQRSKDNAHFLGFVPRHGLFPLPVATSLSET